MLHAWNSRSFTDTFPIFSLNAALAAMLRQTVAAAAEAAMYC